MAGWCATFTLGSESQPLVMSLFTQWMVLGWKSLRGSRVEMVICEFGKDVAAFSATLVTRLPTFSCSSCRLLMPVWIRIWPDVGKDLECSLSSGAPDLDTFILGKRFCSWLNLPFEPIRIATSVSFFRVLVSLPLCHPSLFRQHSNSVQSVGFKETEGEDI